MRRPCLHPGCSNTTTGTRCEEHETRRQKHDGRSSTQRGLGAAHQRMAKRVLSEEKTCWICGETARPDDPLTADHIIPRSLGGTNARSNYHAAHSSCNSRRGAKVMTVPEVVDESEERYAV